MKDRQKLLATRQPYPPTRTQPPLSPAPQPAPAGPSSSPASTRSSLSAAPTADRRCAFSPSLPTPNPRAPSSATSTSLTPRRYSPPHALRPRPHSRGKEGCPPSRPGQAPPGSVPTRYRRSCLCYSCGAPGQPVGEHAHPVRHRDVGVDGPRRGARFPRESVPATSSSVNSRRSAAWSRGASGLSTCDRGVHPRDFLRGHR